MNEGPLIEFSYISKSTSPMATLQLIQLFDGAYKFNQAQGITGVLFYEKQYFAQILEGNGQTVSALWKRIRQDPRHEIIRELICQNIDKRHLKGRSKMSVYPTN
ncbi:BLUF domain-containing protein [Polynucleobacter paneuropaeus]|nr:BLUF domain-containing protein [Polynucleobacter paneuropaeus]MBT8554438.1 BLUF domain-containing protein [Polynucleobacter paneuropaeus]MBT8559715.1 BLUF domain-containing protein [Polynucleobacter paneuropaeus]